MSINEQSTDFHAYILKRAEYRCELCGHYHRAVGHRNARGHFAVQKGWGAALDCATRGADEGHYELTRERAAELAALANAMERDRDGNRQFFVLDVTVTADDFCAFCQLCRPVWRAQEAERRAEAPRPLRFSDLRNGDLVRAIHVDQGTSLAEGEVYRVTGKCKDNVGLHRP